MKSIDLGQKCDMCPVPVSDPAPKAPEPEVHYPSVYIDGGKELADLPSSGTMTAQFKVVSRTAKTDKNGKVSYSLCIELTKIEDAEADDSKPEDREAILDKLAEEDDD